MPRHSMYQRISTTLDICCIIQYSIQAQKSQGSKGVKWHFEKKNLKNISFTFSKRKINIGSLWPQSRQWLRKKFEFENETFARYIFSVHYSICMDDAWKLENVKQSLYCLFFANVKSALHPLLNQKCLGGFWKNFWISLWKLAKWCGTSMDMLSWP